MRRILPTWAAVAAALVLLIYALPSNGATAFGPPGIKGGKFEVTCKFSNHNQVDPIVSPGQQMSAHLHEFFGNRNITADSTPDSVRGLSTTCKVAEDTAGYWVPALYRSTTGALVQPVKIFAYYFGLPGRVTEAPPAGLELVAGDSHAHAPQGKAIISWSCGNGGHSHSPVRAEPYDCTTEPNIVSQGLVAIIKFPWCWNGTGLTKADVVYGDPKTGACPAEYPHILPQLQEHIHYGNSVSNPGFERGDLVELASDQAEGVTGGLTMHADWMNAWAQSRLEQEVADCTAVRKDCGFLTS